MKKVAVILTGCGHRDGSEITETVSTLVSLAEFGAEYECYADNREVVVVNHIDEDLMPERRNMMVEAARITRGKIHPLSQINVQNYDALIIPGGMGAALHLSTWASHGAKCKVDEMLARIIVEFHNQGKPICAICIAPALVARVLGEKKITVTIGTDTETSMEIAKTGAIHENCPVDDFCTDRENKIITTPAYMGKATPFQVFSGIRGAIRETLQMA